MRFRHGKAALPARVKPGWSVKAPAPIGPKGPNVPVMPRSCALRGVLGNSRRLAAAKACGLPYRGDERRPEERCYRPKGRGISALKAADAA